MVGFVFHSLNSKLPSSSLWLSEHSSRQLNLSIGSVVSVDDFYALLDKFRAESSDHTSGFHISEDHLEVESQDRQDVTMCMQLLSERTRSGQITERKNIV